MFRLGCHITITKGFNSSVEFAHEMGCTAMQIFLKSPKGKYTFRRSQKELNIMRVNLKMYNMTCIVHASYLLNFCRDLTDPICKKAVISLINDIKDADTIGAKGVVVHMGKAVGMKKDIAIANYIKGVTHCLNETKKCKIKILLETGASVGTEVCSRIDELGRLYKMFLNRERLGICIDTAHIWGSGYDISTQGGVMKFYREVKEHIGWENVDLIHLNDSKVFCGSKKDSHESIGEGEIGVKGLGDFVTICRHHDIPIVLETPTSGKDREKEVRMIHNWYA
jgi:deoxyribonuclease-4